MSVDYGIYTTKGKRMLLAIRAMVNGRKAVAYVKNPGDVVIDPCAGSGATLRAARELGRDSYGFEVSRDFYLKAKEQMLGEEAV